MGFFSSLSAISAIASFNINDKDLSKKVIKIGTWEGKAIEWIILKEENGNLLLLSKTILFQSKYDDDSNNWKQSYICKYLNNEFYDTAFSTSEKKAIINAKLEDVQNAKNDIFLLSRNEAENLLDNSLRAIGVWLLRTPWDGGDSNRILRVLDDGRISIKSSGCTSSCNVTCRYGIRPAMWIRGC